MTTPDEARQWADEFDLLIAENEQRLSKIADRLTKSLLQKTIEQLAGRAALLRSLADQVEAREELAAHDYAKRLTARAALLAALPHLREPSAAMVDAGMDVQFVGLPHSWSGENELREGARLISVWRAMFDAMLKEIGDG